MDKTPIAMPGPYGFQEEITFTLSDYFKQLHERFPDEKFDTTSDVQVGGTHYRRNALQPWDIFIEWGLDPWAANVVKYILRFPYKNHKEDLEKARHYINYLINNIDAIEAKYYHKDK